MRTRHALPALLSLPAVLGAGAVVAMSQPVTSRLATRLPAELAGGLLLALALAVALLAGLHWLAVRALRLHSPEVIREQPASERQYVA